MFESILVKSHKKNYCISTYHIKFYPPQAFNKCYTILMSWQRLKRKTLIDTRFLKVYVDQVKLSNGDVIDDYTVIEVKLFKINS